MAMREKLIELCEDVILSCKSSLCADCEHNGIDYPNCMGVHFADHLIANGVTIPVHCHECEHWKNEINGCTEDKRFCNIGYYMVHKDGFCSFGKKIENH